jgi:hypothetical protein
LLLAFLGLLFDGLVEHLPLSSLMVIIIVPQCLSVPHFTLILLRALETMRLPLQNVVPSELQFPLIMSENSL